MTVPKGWAWQPVIRWGDPLFAGAPEFDPLHQSAAAQARQFGYNCDYLDILPMQGRRGRRALAVVNHEYTNENLMFPPTSDPAVLDEQKRIAMAAHGLTVVELRRSAPGRPWTYVRDSALQPPDHRADPVRPHRARCRPPAAADRGRPGRPGRARHPEQLRRRHHPVGHRAVR